MDEFVGSGDVKLDYDTVSTLRDQHPAWRLLASNNAALIVAFLNRVFVEPNAREIRQADLVEALEDDHETTPSA